MPSEYILLQHRDDRQRGHTATRVRSPWLPFLLGVAVSALCFTLLSNTRHYKPTPLHPFRIHYLGNPSKNDRAPAIDNTCPIQLIFTTDHRAADAVIWNSDDHSSQDFDRQRLRVELPWQSQVVYGVESAPQRPKLLAHCA
jgi:hypothetical protein